jgi:hypothetical protein
MKERERLSSAVVETAAMAQNDRSNVYQDITDAIIADLERGCVPWAQPWDSAAGSVPFTIPRNASTRRPYSGINILTLWSAAAKRKFTGHDWLTFRQALAVGANVRKGERGVTVVYADRFIPEATRERARETGDAVTSIPFLKRFTLFNADQCEGLPVDPEAPQPPPEAIIPAADAVIVATGADIRIGGGEAFYIIPFSITFRSPRFTPTLSQPIGFERYSMSYRIALAIPRASTATNRACSARRPMRARNSSRKWPAPSFAPHLASPRPFVTPTISDPGSRSFEKTIARSRAPRARPRRRRITSFNDRKRRRHPRRPDRVGSEMQAMPRSESERRAGDR